MTLMTACTPKSQASGAITGATASEGLATHGKRVYSQNCIACHNPNPKLDGAVGPAIYESSLELVTARVLHANYPPGYKPKRLTGQMPAFPSLEKELPALHAFLNQ